MRQEQPDAPVDYTALHRCITCSAQHYLDVLPVEGGWIAGVRCDCRGKGGGPLTYSTESPVFPTYERASTSRRALLRMAVTT